MPTKSLNALAIPLVISFTFRFLFTLVDLIYVAEIEDEVPYGAAAIGLFIPIQTLFIALWVGLSAGFTTAISQAFGKHDEARVRALKRSMVKIHIGLVPLLLLFALGVRLVTPMLNLAPELERDFLTYALILICMMPFSGFLSIYPDSIVKAHHDTMSTMKAGIFSTIANVILNTIFVFVFHWGIAGIALATGISRYASLGYAAWRTHILETARRTPDWDRGDGNWVRTPMVDLLALGLPGGLSYLLIFAEDLLVTTLLTRESGAEVYLAGYAVYSRLVSLAIMPAVATAVAVLPFVARLVAEDRRGDVRRDLRSSLFVTAGLVGAIAIPAGWIFPRQLAQFFLAERITEAGEQVVWYLALIPVAALIMLPFLLFRPVFEAVGEPRIGVRVTVLKSLAFGIPGLLLGFGTAKMSGSDPFLGLLLGAISGQLVASIVTTTMCRKLLAEDGSASDPDQNKIDLATRSPS